MKISKKLLLCVAAALMILLYFNQPPWAKIFAALQAMTGVKGLIVFSLLYLISNFLLFPTGLPLNLLSGLLWGTFAGGALINLLAAIAASISFLLARRFGSTFFEKYLSRYDWLRNFNNTINRYDWQFIWMVRINPIIPFCLSSYLFGLIPGLSFRRYILTTIIANLLPSFAFSSIGAIFKTISLTNTNIKYWIMNIGVALLLLSGVWLLKKCNPVNQDLLLHEKEIV